MPVPPLASPVGQTIHPFGWIRPSGVFEFRITQTFNQINPAISKLPHHAIDIGNGRLGDPVFACGDGVILAEGWVGEPWSDPAPLLKRLTWGPTYGGIMAVIDHGGGWVTAYAHMARTIIDKGQKVKAGQQIGNIGDTGAAYHAGHLHLDVYHDNVKVDPWPLLAQNYALPPDTATEEPMKLTKSLIGKTAYVKGNGYVHSSPDAFESSRVFQVGPNGSNTGRALIGTVEGVATYGDSTWYVYVLGTDLRYFHASQVVELKDWAGATTSDLKAAQDHAAALLTALNQANARITGIRASAEPVPVPK